MDLHAPGGVREVRLQRRRLPEAADLRGPQGRGVLRRRVQEAAGWIRVSLH